MALNIIVDESAENFDSFLDLLGCALPEDHPVLLNGRICKAMMGIDTHLGTIQQWACENDEEPGKLYAIIGFVEGMRDVIAHFASDLVAADEKEEEKA